MTRKVSFFVSFAFSKRTSLVLGVCIATLGVCVALSGVRAAASGVRAALRFEIDTLFLPSAFFDNIARAMLRF